MLHFERIENLSSEFQNIDSMHSILKMLGPFFKGCICIYNRKNLIFWYKKNVALADENLMLAPLPDPGAGIDHFGISFSLLVLFEEKIKNKC